MSVPGEAWEGSWLVYPDLLWVFGWGWAAVHVALAPIAIDRLEAKLRGWAGARRVRVVVFFVDDLAIGQSIRLTAERLGVSESELVVRVERVRPPRP